MMIVFPSTNSNEPKEKIITEYNICNIVNRLVNRDAFVISAVKSDTSTGSELSISFNIRGYIFSTNNLWGEGVKNTDTVYAQLKITQATGTNSPYWDTYDRLELTTTEPDPKAGFYLQLWDGNGENGKVPRESWIKFDNGAVYIDDGDLG